MASCWLETNSSLSKVCANTSVKSTLNRGFKQHIRTRPVSTIPWLRRLLTRWIFLLLRVAAVDANDVARCFPRSFYCLTVVVSCQPVGATANELTEDQLAVAMTTGETLDVVVKRHLRSAPNSPRSASVAAPAQPAESLHPDDAEDLNLTAMCVVPTLSEFAGGVYQVPLGPKISHHPTPPRHTHHALAVRVHKQIADFDLPLMSCPGHLGIRIRTRDTQPTQKQRPTG